jgi:hypothetical protein
VQFTLIAIQQNGQQVILGRDVQEYGMNNLLHEAVGASRSYDRPESKYRSFISIGTTMHVTHVTRYSSDGHAVSRTAGTV